MSTAIASFCGRTLGATLTWFGIQPTYLVRCVAEEQFSLLRRYLAYNEIDPDLSHRITSFLQHSFSALASGRHVGRESAQLCASCGFGEVESADTEQLIVYAIDNKRVLHSASACAMQKIQNRQEQSNLRGQTAV